MSTPKHNLKLYEIHFKIQFYKLYKTVFKNTIIKYNELIQYFELVKRPIRGMYDCGKNS